MNIQNLAAGAVNIVYTFFYFVIISRIIISFIHISQNGFYHFIMNSSELVISPFRRFSDRNGLVDFSPLLALLALMLGRGVLHALIIYLPANDLVGLGAAVLIVLIDLADLLLGFYLAVVCVYYFIKLKIRQLLHTSFHFIGGFSPDRLLFLFGGWCNPVLIPLGRILPESLKKYTEIILILLIIIVKLLLKYFMTSLKYLCYTI